MAALYVTGITRSVLTGSTLLFFGILLRVGYSLSVCGPVFRECIAISSRQFPMVTGSLSMLGLSQRAHLSVDHF